MASKSICEIYPKWDLIRLNYKQFSSSSKLNDLNQSDLEYFRSQGQLLREILNDFVFSSKIKDSFYDDGLYPYPHGGMSLEFHSKKLENSINFGIYDGYIFLETYIIYSQYLHKMTDEFWIRLMQLPSYGHFEFEPSDIQVDKESDLKIAKLTDNKSKLFNIITNFILRGADECFLSLGMLSIKWPLDICTDKLINNGYESFKILYKTNYDLYRYFYQLAHGRSKSKKG